MSTRDRLTLAVALAVALGSSALHPLFDGVTWLPRVLGAILVVAAAGLLGRRIGLPRPLQPVLGLLALALYVGLVFAGGTLHLLLLPGHDTVTAIRILVGQAFTDTRELAPPVPTNSGLVLLAVAGVGGTAVLVDTVAVAFGRAAVAGLPLLVLFAVPSAVLPGGVGWLPFCLGAAGWLGLLLVEGGDRVRHWGVPLRPGPLPPPEQREDSTLGRVGRRIGAAALGVALAVPVIVPGLDGGLLGGGGGGTGGPLRSGRSSTTYNPITTLRGQLTLPVPQVLLSYTSSDPQPDYLRLTTLDRFDGRGWSSSQLKGDPGRDAVGNGIPTPEGLDLSRTVPVNGTFTIADLDTRWLPVPFPPRSVAVRGPWVWDARAQSVFSAPRTTKDLDGPYTVTASRVVPQRGSLSDVGQVPQDVAPYAQPVQLTPYVDSEVRRVTAGARTDFAKVEALQAYFLDANRFAYSTDADAPGFGTDDALERFLRNGKGFCEQYSSAMAAMVRSLGIPARVAVGFTPGTAAGSTYTVTTSDAHAWPEVWFSGLGWIRFEPTPRADGTTSVPAYARPAAAPGPAGSVDGTLPGGGAAPTATARPGGRNSKENDLYRPEPAPAPPASPPAPASSLPPLRVLVGAGLLLLLVSPAGLHAVRSRRSHSDPLTAWSRVCEDATDVGHRWRPNESPRTAAAGLAAGRALGPEAVAALDRLASAAERVRYARPGAVPGDGSPVGDVATVRRALLSRVSVRTRWRARLFPRSTLRAVSHAAGSLTADVLDRFDEGVAALGHALRPRSGSA